MQSTGGTDDWGVAGDRSDLLARLVDPPAPGWYPDPADQALQRLWSGARWAAGRRRTESGTIFGFEYLEGGAATTSGFDRARPTGFRRLRGAPSVLAAGAASERGGPTPLRTRGARAGQAGPWAVGAATVLVIAAVSVEHLTTTQPRGHHVARGAGTASTASGSGTAARAAPPATSMPPTNAWNPLPTPATPAPSAATAPSTGPGVPSIDPAPHPAGVSSSPPRATDSASPTNPAIQSPPATTSPGDVALGRGTTPGTSPTVLANAHGSGIAETTTFATRGPWSVYWSYDCSASRPGSFDFAGYSPDGHPTDLYGPGQSGSGGSGIEHYSEVGSFVLVVNSGCIWDIQIVG